MTMKDAAAVVGIGRTKYYRRGQSWPEETKLSMACKAILAALDDAGLTIDDLDGFALFAQACEPAEVAAALGMKEVRYTTMITGGGGASAASLGVAASAIHAGMAECVVTVMTVQQHNQRLGGSAVPSAGGGGQALSYGGAGMGLGVAEHGVHRQQRDAQPRPRVGADRAAAHAPVRHAARGTSPRSRCRRATTRPACPTR